MDINSRDKYHIFIFDPKVCFVVGKDGMYEDSISQALSFNNKYDAVKYIEKHGIQKISTIRRFVVK